MPVTAHRAKLAGCVLDDGALSSSLYVDTETQRIVRRSANGQSVVLSYLIWSTLTFITFTIGRLAGQ